MITRSTFRPAWWLANAHMQTLWPALAKVKAPVTRRERIELPDGDFLDLDWNDCGHDAGNPVVVIMHGLQGSLKSHYVRRLMKALARLRIRTVLLYFRGCSGAPNRLPRTYHSGDTADIDYVVTLLKDREPNVPICAVGYSLGGNVLLKWLGEKGTDAPLNAAAAISVPFVPALAAARLDHGFSRIYQYTLLRSLRQTIRMKFGDGPAPIDLRNLHQLTTFRLFDNHVTARLNGFRNVDDYYSRSGSRAYLSNITVPTLILHSEDDPFMSPYAIPGESELSSKITLELSPKGGHVGFVAGRIPFLPVYWLETRLREYLSEHLLDPPQTRHLTRGAQ